MIKFKLPFRLFFILLLSPLSPLSPLPAQADGPPSIPDDLLPLVEASLELVETVSGDLFPGLAQAPLNLLLLTEGVEFYLSDTAPAERYSFQRVAGSVGTRNIYVRGNHYDLSYLATFPAVGVPTIVMGTPENTGRTHLGWALIMVHERFHTLQATLPGFSEGVRGLDLAGDDESGMWMLNYDFPYDDPEIGALFYTMSQSLASARRGLVEVAYGGAEALAQKVEDYLTKKAAFRAGLSDADYRYFEFVVWREGMARYVQSLTPIALMRRHYDSDGFGGNVRAALTLEAVRLNELSQVNLLSPNALRSLRREIFYAVGHYEGLLLDEIAPGWQDRYAGEMFSTDSYFSN